MVERSKSVSGVNCLECRLRRRNEWRVLAEEELKLLAQSRKCRLYQAGEPIFSAGEPSHGIYCVTSGTVAIRKVDAEGNPVLVQLGYPGDTLGYRGLLLGENRRSSAEALGPSKVCFIDRGGGENPAGSKSRPGSAIPAARRHRSGRCPRQAGPERHFFQPHQICPSVIGIDESPRPHRHRRQQGDAVAALAPGYGFDDRRPP